MDEKSETTPPPSIEYLRRTPEEILTERARLAAISRSKNLPRKVLSRMQSVIITTASLFMLGGSFLREKNNLYLPLLLQLNKQEPNSQLSLSPEITDAILNPPLFSIEPFPTEISDIKESVGGIIQITEENTYHPIPQIEMLYEAIDESSPKNKLLEISFKDGKLVDSTEVTDFNITKEKSCGLASEDRIAYYLALKESIKNISELRNIDQKYFDDSFIFAYGQGLVILDKKTKTFTAYLWSSDTKKIPRELELAFQDIPADLISSLVDAYKNRSPLDLLDFIRESQETGIDYFDFEIARSYFEDKLDAKYFEVEPERRESLISSLVRESILLAVDNKLPLKNILTAFEKIDGIADIFTFTGIDTGQSDYDKMIFLDNNIWETIYLIRTLCKVNEDKMKDTKGIEEVFNDIKDIYQKYPAIFEEGMYFFSYISKYYFNNDYKEAINIILNKKDFSLQAKKDMLNSFILLTDHGYDFQTALFIINEASSFYSVDPNQGYFFNIFMENPILGKEDIKNIIHALNGGFNIIRDYYKTNRDDKKRIANPKYAEFQLFYDYYTYFSGQYKIGRDYKTIAPEEFKLLLSIGPCRNLIWYTTEYRVNLSGVSSKEGIFDKLADDLNNTDWKQDETKTVQIDKLQRFVEILNSVHSWEIIEYRSDSLRINTAGKLSVEALFMLISEGTLSGTEYTDGWLDVMYTSTFMALYNSLTSRSNEEIDQILQKNSREVPGFILALGRYGVLPSEIAKRPQYFLSFIKNMLQENYVENRSYLIAQGIKTGLESKSSHEYQEMIVDLYSQPDETGQKKAFAAYLMVQNEAIFLKGEFRDFYARESWRFLQPEVIQMPDLNEPGKIMAVFYYNEEDEKIESNNYPGGLSYFTKQGYEKEQLNSRNWLLTKKTGEQEITILITYEDQKTAEEYWKVTQGDSFHPDIIAFLQHSTRFLDFFDKSSNPIEDKAIYFIGSCGSAGLQTYLLDKGYSEQMMMERQTAVPAASLVMLDSLINYRLSGAKLWENYIKQNKITIGAYKLAMPTDFDMQVNAYVNRFIRFE